MKQIIKILNIFVFVAATLAIMGVFYEGMSLQWFPIVSVLIIIMDFSFMLSSVINLIFCRENKVIFSFSILSIGMIAVAFIMKAMKIEYPIISFVFWYFYIWFYYGFLLSKQLWRKEKMT